MAVKHIPWNKTEDPTIDIVSSELSKEGYGKLAFPWPRGHHHGPAKTTHQECFWLARGTIIFESGGTKIEMKAGDRVLCDKDVSYTIEVNSPTGCFLMQGRK